MPTIVQFFHPFIEAEPINSFDNYIPWNNNENHRRKFIMSEGNFISNNDLESQAELVFWGECEAQSKIKRIIKTNPNPPNYINFPYLDQSVLYKTHTTDPYVFGKCFKYFICLQGQFSNILRNLE